MRSSEIIKVQPGSVGTLHRHMPFLEGTFIASVFPISDSEEYQVASAFSAVLKWSPNAKFWITEPITESSLTSDGESLVTIVQAPNLKVEVTNNSGAEQKYYVSIASVETAS